MLCMGKSTISTGPFSSSQTVTNYQAGYDEFGDGLPRYINIHLYFTQIHQYTSIFYPDTSIYIYILPRYINIHHIYIYIYLYIYIHIYIYISLHRSFSLLSTIFTSAATTKRKWHEMPSVQGMKQPAGQTAFHKGAIRSSIQGGRQWALKQLQQFKFTTKTWIFQVCIAPFHCSQLSSQVLQPLKGNGMRCHLCKV